MKVHRQNAVDAGCLKHIGNNLRTDGHTSGTRASVLTCIAIVRNNCSNTSSGCSAQRVNHNDQFHQIIICGLAGWLDDENIAAANVLI